jgi:hypothetical protein
MDTLQVFSQQSGGSRHSSRTPSPSRAYQAEQSNYFIRKQSNFLVQFRDIFIIF